MAHIVEVGGERRLQLSNEEIVRTMNIGNRWNKLRIGVRWGINGVDTVIGSQTSMAGIGVCVGTKGYLSESTVSYLGQLQFTTWTHTTVAGPYWAVGSNTYTTVKVGGTVTQNAAGGGINGFIAYAPHRLSQWFVEITKVGAVYTVDYRLPSVTDVMQTVLVYDFLRNMENEVGSRLWCSATTATIANCTRTIAPETYFDSVSLFHGFVAPTMEIGSLEVVRFE